MDNMNYWPYTNIHELNLDWIISKIKELDTRFTDDIETYVQQYINEHFAEWTVNANYDPDNETIIYTNGTGATLTAGDVIRFAIDNAYVNVKDPTARTAASNAQDTADDAATAAAAAQSTADKGLTDTATKIFDQAITPEQSTNYVEYTLDYAYTNYKYLLIIIGNYTNINAAMTLPVSLFNVTSVGAHVLLEDSVLNSQMFVYKGSTTSKIYVAHVGSNSTVHLQIYGLS